ncbi:MAG: hypothetical protein NC320_03105 [Clostridium sp.]|nr:hypothetical protein [Clostridium sp.]
MRRKYTVSPDGRKKIGIKASRNVKTSSRKRRRRAVTAAKLYTDGFDNYQPWSGAVETWETLEKFGKLNALEQYIDEVYYNEGMGEGVINETELNDLLWFEPEHIYEMVGLYYDDETGEVSDESFDEEDY